MEAGSSKKPFSRPPQESSISSFKDINFEKDSLAANDLSAWCVQQGQSGAAFGRARVTPLRLRDAGHSRAESGVNPVTAHWALAILGLVASGSAVTIGVSLMFHMHMFAFCVGFFICAISFFSFGLGVFNFFKPVNVLAKMEGIFLAVSLVLCGVGVVFSLCLAGVYGSIYECVKSGALKSGEAPPSGYYSFTDVCYSPAVPLLMGMYLKAAATGSPADPGSLRSQTLVVNQANLQALAPVIDSSPILQAWRAKADSFQIPALIGGNSPDTAAATFPQPGAGSTPGSVKLTAPEAEKVLFNVNPGKLASYNEVAPFADPAIAPPDSRSAAGPLAAAGGAAPLEAETSEIPLDSNVFSQPSAAQPASDGTPVENGSGSLGGPVRRLATFVEDSGEDGRAAGGRTLQALGAFSRSSLSAATPVGVNTGPATDYAGEESRDAAHTGSAASADDYSASGLSGPPAFALEAGELSDPIGDAQRPLPFYTQLSEAPSNAAPMDVGTARGAEQETLACLRTYSSDISFAYTLEQHALALMEKGLFCVASRDGLTYRSEWHGISCDRDCGYAYFFHNWPHISLMQTNWHVAFEQNRHQRTFSAYAEFLEGAPPEVLQKCLELRVHTACSMHASQYPTKYVFVSAAICCLSFIVLVASVIVYFRMRKV